MPSIGIGIGIGMSSGSGSGFSPASLSGLIAWYRSDRGITIATGVSQWNDISGNGNHLVQATTTKQPPFDADSGPNGHPFVGTFDNVDDFLQDAFTLSQPIDAFLVIKPSASGAGNGTIMDGAAGANSMRLFVSAANTLGIFAGTAIVSAAATETAFHRVRGEFNGASSGITVDNGSRVAGNAGAASPGGVTLGIFGDGSSDPSDSQIVEAIFYNRILTTEATQVQAYLTARYGI
jgi:hypothetical protein